MPPCVTSFSPLFGAIPRGDPAALERLHSQRPPAVEAPSSKAQRCRDSLGICDGCRAGSARYVLFGPALRRWLVNPAWWAMGDRLPTNRDPTGLLRLGHHLLVKRPGAGAPPRPPISGEHRADVRRCLNAPQATAHDQPLAEPGGGARICRLPGLEKQRSAYEKTSLRAAGVPSSVAPLAPPHSAASTAQLAGAAPDSARASPPSRLALWR